MKNNYKAEVISNINKERKDMNTFLYESVDKASTREKLLEQLSWLDKQMDYYAQQEDLHPLVDKFNWVVSNFNNDLHLKSEEKFNYLD